MHDSVMRWGDDQLTYERVHGHHVLEVGALDINGSWAPFVTRHAPKSYVRTDMQPGANVDEVVRAEDLLTWAGDRRYELIICSEMLEHAEHWQECVHIMKQLLTDDGTLLLTTRSPTFPIHSFPNDYWRFTLQHMFQAFSDMRHEVFSDWEQPGVFVIAQAPCSDDDPVFAVEALDVNRVQA